jgi:hypothetical protein
MLQHGGGQMRLIWLYDIHLLITHHAERLDWAELVQQAHRFRWAPALHAALQATQDIFGTALPPDVFANLAAMHDPQAARAVQRLSRPISSRTAFFWNELVTLNWAARYALIRAYLFPTPAYLRWRYQTRLPDWLWPLYYPYRWFDLAQDSLSTMIHIARQRGA